MARSEQRARSDELAPVRVSEEPTLFQVSLAELCRLAGVTPEQLQRWHRRGWLSFDPAQDGQFDEWHYHELVFIRSLVASGIGEVLVGHLLDKLEPPYRYRATRTAYCFGLGRWVRVWEEPDIGEIISEHWDSWLAGLAQDGEIGRLEDIAEYARELAERDEPDDE